VTPAHNIEIELETRRPNPRESGVDILGHAILHFADETQRQMEVLRLHPSRAGKPGAEHRQALARCLGQFDADKQAYQGYVSWKCGAGD
jgi:hypothetical protein